MSGRRSLRCNDLSARSGPGAQSRSLAKRRDTHNRKPVVGIGGTLKKAMLGARLSALLDGPSAADASRTEEPGPSGRDVKMEDSWVDEPLLPAPTPPPPLQLFNIAHPDTKCVSTVRAWDAMLPRLEQPFLQYRRDTHGHIPPIIPAALDNPCGASCPAPYTLLVQCLYPTRK
jgi:hypothetical protein